MPFCSSAFYENTRTNTALAKRRTRPKIKGIGRLCTMTPDEVLEKLKQLGVSMSRQTLRNYEKWELIPEPKRGSKGKGRGRYTDYPLQTVAEAFASWKLLHGKISVQKEDAAKIRNLAQHFETTGDFRLKRVEYIPFYIWLTSKIRIEQNVADDKIIAIYYVKDVNNRPTRMIVLQIDRDKVVPMPFLFTEFAQLHASERKKYKQTGSDEHLFRAAKAFTLLRHFGDNPLDPDDRPEDEINFVDLNTNFYLTLYHYGHAIHHPKP